MGESYSLGRIRALVQRIAPMWYLHDDEEYLPSSVDWYLDRVTLVSKDGARVPLAAGGGAPEDRLPLCSNWPYEGEADDYWLEAAERDWGGDVASARAYVSIRRVKAGYLDVSFWFFYPGNGCGSARLRTLAFDTTIYTEERVELTTLGFHVSDWEKVTVRVTDDAANAIDSVYFAQHDGGHWLRLEKLERVKGGQFAVHASRSGHASYPTASDNLSKHVKTAPRGTWAKLTPSALEFWLRNDTMKGRHAIDCAARHEIIHIHEGADGIALTADDDGDDAGAPFYGRVERAADGSVRLREPKWLNYPYRWGQETEQKITHATMFAALKAAAVPLAVYGAMTLGAMLPILGAIAGLLVPVFLKMDPESGTQGPKVKFTKSGEIDAESEPEPDNLFDDAVDGPLAAMVDWVASAGKDVARWTEQRGREIANRATGAGTDVANWATGVGEETAEWATETGTKTANWATGVGTETASWATGIGTDTAGWAADVGKDTGEWFKDKGLGVADWAKDVASEAEREARSLKDKLNPLNL